MRLVLLGDPVAHSRSPAMHQAALDALGIPGSYRARPVDEDGLREALEELRSGLLAGANVTMPHKHRAAHLADRLEGDAGRTGSVNTLVRMEGGTVVGHNTDVDGVRVAWRRAGLPEEAPVLVLGAGGAAGAALVALEGREVRVAARRPDRARALLERLEMAGRVVPWREPQAGAVVVNATPIGMRGEPLPAGVLEAAEGLLDMVYGDRPTPAVRRMEERGRPAADGLEMLLGQGAASFRLWTGREAPIDVMEAALRA